MTQSLSIARTITSMAQLRERFTIAPATDDNFFPEWRDRAALIRCSFTNLATSERRLQKSDRTVLSIHQRDNFHRQPYRAVRL